GCYCIGNRRRKFSIALRKASLFSLCLEFIQAVLSMIIFRIGDLFGVGVSLFFHRVIFGHILRWLGEEVGDILGRLCSGLCGFFRVDHNRFVKLDFGLALIRSHWARAYQLAGIFAKYRDLEWIGLVVFQPANHILHGVSNSQFARQAAHLLL